MSSADPNLELINESDRGAVIVAAALLEDDLTELLKAMVNKNGLSRKHIEDIFDLNGPLSSFSSKILICYGLGLITKSIFDDLTKIRRLRNRLAHSPASADFMSPEMENYVATINCCRDASKAYVGKMFSGREQENSKTSHTASSLPDWKARSMGFVKYTKSVFCVGVALLRNQIRQHQLIRKT